MPAALHTTAVVLSRQASGSDSFEQVGVFSGTEGALLCLRRLPRAAAGQPPPLDLFDEAELWLESRSQGRTWFIKEHRHVARRPGIGRSYASLQAAARLALLVQRNPVPDDSRAPIAALLQQALGALDAGARPDLVWLKALYRFLRDEGYPVKQHWWQGLTLSDRATAAALLHTRAADPTAPAEDIARLTRALEAWVAGDTEIRLA